MPATLQAAHRGELSGPKLRMTVPAQAFGARVVDDAPVSGRIPCRCVHR
jgi:hypothetical protein